MAHNIPCNKIAIMQLFHELKQKFPTVPDEIVNECLQQNLYDRHNCEISLREEFKKYRLSSYPPSIAEKYCDGKNRCRPNSLSINCDPSTSIYNCRSFSCCCCNKNTETPVSCRHVDKVCACDRACENIAKSVDNIEITSGNVSDTNGKLSITDLNLKFINDKCGCERTRLRFKYNDTAGSSQSAPTTPVNKLTEVNEKAKQRNSLNLSNCISPVNFETRRPFTSVNLTLRPPSTEPQLPLDIAAKGSQLTYSTKVTEVNEKSKQMNSRNPSNSIPPVNFDTRRPFTSVNLTLRPPSTEPQPPIEVAAKGSQLTYSAYSFNSEVGYRNKLRICIDEDGAASFSALRTKTSPPNEGSMSCNMVTSSTGMNCNTIADQFELPEFSCLPPPVKLKLQEQISSKLKLQCELDKEKMKLLSMKLQVSQMEKELEMKRMKPKVSPNVVKLRDRVKFLENECMEMIRKIDQSTGSKVSLGDTNLESYINLVAESSKSDIERLQKKISEGSGNKWMCHMCTFLNHELLGECEECNMHRVDCNFESDGMVKNIGEPSEVYPSEVNPSEVNQSS